MNIPGPGFHDCTVPDLIYYRFENNPNSTSTPNYAVPGVSFQSGTTNRFFFFPGLQEVSLIPACWEQGQQEVILILTGQQISVQEAGQ